MTQPYPGRHELGQNFLVAKKYKSLIVDNALKPGLPIVELAAGDGAISVDLARRATRFTAVEIDPRRTRKLRTRLGRHARVVQADLLEFRLPSEGHTVVANLPFHLTTSALRRLLSAPHWEHAVLVTQWEVARRRAGVGGGSLLTATWSPWFRFELLARVPASAFRPVPSVDGGLFTVVRRESPLVGEKGRYQRFIASIFKAPGSDITEKAVRSGRLSRKAMRAWMRSEGLPPSTRPRDVSADQWASLWAWQARHRSGNASRGGRR